MNQNIKPSKLYEKSNRRKIIRGECLEDETLPNIEGKPHTSARKRETPERVHRRMRDWLKGKKTAASTELPPTNYADKELKVINKTNTQTQRSEVQGDAHERVLIRLQLARTSPSPPPSSTPTPSPPFPWNQVPQQVSSAPPISPCLCPLTSPGHCPQAH